MNNILKKLTILSLLILFLPFFQTCSNKNIIHNSWLKNSPMSEEVTETNSNKSAENLKEFNLSFEELNLKKEKAINNFLKSKKELTSNGYELGMLTFEGIDLKNLHVKENINFITLPFTLTLLITLLLIYFSFKKKYKMILIFSIINFLLLLSPLILLILAEYFEDIEQLKIGYYLMFLNLTLIMNQSYIGMRKEKTNG